MKFFIYLILLCPIMGLSQESCEEIEEIQPRARAVNLQAQELVILDDGDNDGSVDPTYSHSVVGSMLNFATTESFRISFSKTDGLPLYNLNANGAYQIYARPFALMNDPEGNPTLIYTLRIMASGEAAARLFRLVEDENDRYDHSVRFAVTPNFVSSLTYLNANMLVNASIGFGPTAGYADFSQTDSHAVAGGQVTFSAFMRVVLPRDVQLTLIGSSTLRLALTNDLNQEDAFSSNVVLLRIASPSIRNFRPYISLGGIVNIYRHGSSSSATERVVLPMVFGAVGVEFEGLGRESTRRRRKTRRQLRRR